MSKDRVTLEIGLVQCHQAILYLLFSTKSNGDMFVRFLFVDKEDSEGGLKLLITLNDLFCFKLFQTSSSSVLSLSMFILRSEKAIYTRCFAHHSVESVCGRLA